MAGCTLSTRVGFLALVALLGACGSAERRPEPSAAAGGNAGAAGSGAAPAGSAGQAWTSPVAPEVSQQWSWQECGRIAPDPTDELRHEGGIEILSLAISADGQLLVSDTYKTIGWRVAEAFGESQPLWRTGAEGGINVALSPDGRLGSISGDVRLIFDTTTGEDLFWQGAETLATIAQNLCIGSEFNFSPDGRFVAGKHYTTTVDVYETQGLTLVGHFPTSGCAQGIAFSADGETVWAPDGSARLSELSQGSPGEALPTQQPRGWDSLTRAPDGSLVPVSCMEYACQNGDTYSETMGGRHLDISAEGHWHVLGRELHHLPSGERRVFDELATEAVFAPNGDLIAGERDASLVRFCRSD